jgi:hypothetical protein
LKQQEARHRHEQQQQAQRQARRMEETMKAESMKLEARVRQLEHHLRKKEHEVEATLNKERTKWAGASQQSTAAAEAHLRVFRRRAMQEQEKLVMLLHDERSRYGALIDSLSVTNRQAGAAVGQLKEELQSVQKARDRAIALVAAGANQNDKSKGAAMEAARVRHLMEQLRLTEEELAKARATAADAIAAAAAAATHAGTPWRPPPAPNTELSAPKPADATATPTKPLLPEFSLTRQPSMPALLPTEAARSDAAALEHRVADLVAGRDTAVAGHRAAIAAAVAECARMRHELDAAHATVASLRRIVEDLRIDAANQRVAVAPAANTTLRRRSRRRRSSRRNESSAAEESDAPPEARSRSGSPGGPLSADEEPTAREQALADLCASLADKVDELRVRGSSAGSAADGPQPAAPGSLVQPSATNAESVQRVLRDEFSAAIAELVRRSKQCQPAGRQPGCSGRGK